VPATPFLPVPSPPPTNWPAAQTRPDRGSSGSIAFSGARANTGTNQVYVVGSDGTALRLVLVPEPVAEIPPVPASRCPSHPLERLEEN
jgi:hypothetical protein